MKWILRANWRILRLRMQPHNSLFLEISMDKLNGSNEEFSNAISTPDVYWWKYAKKDEKPFGSRMTCLVTLRNPKHKCFSIFLAWNKLKGQGINNLQADGSKYLGPNDLKKKKRETLKSGLNSTQTKISTCNFADFCSNLYFFPKLLCQKHSYSNVRNWRKSLHIWEVFFLAFCLNHP